jgi:hypothetical protein
MYRIGSRIRPAPFLDFALQPSRKARAATSELEAGGLFYTSLLRLQRLCRDYPVFAPIRLLVGLMGFDFHLGFALPESLDSPPGIS